MRVLDVSGTPPELGAAAREAAPSTPRAHIPGATFVDWEHDFIDVTDPVPVQVAGAASSRRVPASSESAMAMWS